MIINLFLAIFCFYLLGLSVSILFFKHKKVDLSDLEEIFAFGFAAAGFLMILVSVLSLRFSPCLFFSLSILIFSLAYFLKKPIFTKIKLRQVLLDNFIFMSIISLFLLIVYIKSLSLPVWGYDAYSFWLARAKAFFVDQKITVFNLKNFYPPEHPPLWSLTLSWFYIFLGQPDEVVVRFLPFLIYILMIISFVRETRIKGILKYIFIFFLITLPQIVDNVVNPYLAGNADLFLSFYFLLGTMALLRKEFGKAALFFSLTAWIKVDASTVPLIFIFLIFVLKIKDRIKPILNVFIPTSTLFLAKFFLGISSRYLEPISNRHFLSYLYYDLMAFREELRNISNWHFLWWLFLFVLLVNIKKTYKKKNVFFAYLMIIFQLTSYFIVFLITPENQATHITTALFRLLLHLAPAALFLTFQVATL